MQWITTQHIFLLFFFFGGVWKNNFNASIKWIYISYFSGSSGSRGLCVVLESYSKRPDFSRAESVIPSHADWLGYIWMTVLNLCALSSCLRTLPGGCAFLHLRAGLMFLFASQPEPSVITFWSLSCRVDFFSLSYLKSVWMYTKAQDYLWIHSRMIPNHTRWHTHIQ